MEILEAAAGVEIEKKKEYLQSYGKIIQQLNRSEERIKEIKREKYYPSIIMDGMPHSNYCNDLSDYAAAIEKEEKRYLKYRYIRITKCQEILNKIEKMEDEKEKDVLLLRYIKLLKWEDICVKLSVEWRQVHRLHKRALKNFEMS